MTRKNLEESNWLDDAFDDKKTAEELERARMSSGSKAAVIVCLVIAVVIIVALLGFGFASLSLMSSVAP